MLQQIIARDETPVSANTVLRELNDPAARLFQAVQRYTDGLHVAEQPCGYPVRIVGNFRPCESRMPLKRHRHPWASETS
jgi:hypothetical protein